MKARASTDLGQELEVHPRQLKSSRLCSEWSAVTATSNEGELTDMLAEADPADKAPVYAEMGIEVTYHADGRDLVESRPGVVDECVGGATRTVSPRGGLAATFPTAA